VFNITKFKECCGYCVFNSSYYCSVVTQCQFLHSYTLHCISGL